MLLPLLLKMVGVLERVTGVVERMTSTSQRVMGEGSADMIREAGDDEEELMAVVVEGVAPCQNGTLALCVLDSRFARCTVDIGLG